MGSSKSYREFILDQLTLLDGITDKPMMGEYILYLNGTIIGGIYDDRLLIKITESNKKYNLKEVIPYPNAKSMYMIEDVDDKELIRDIILDTYDNLK